jgi:hypothetical protein
LELLHDVQQWGGYITSSITSKPEWLWDVLSYKVAPNHWRSAINNTIIASLHIMQDNGKFAKKHIVSTAFVATQLLEQPLQQNIQQQVVSTSIIYLKLTHRSNSLY